jgi:hypothetical protein
MKCIIDKVISGTPEKKYYLIHYLTSELEKMLGREIQIYLLINKEQQMNFFKYSFYNAPISSETTNSTSRFSFPSFSFPGFNMMRTNTSNNVSSEPFPESSPSIFSENKYEPEELTVPYKNFHNYFESLFGMNKNKDFQKEKEKNFSLKMYGGNDEQETEQTEETEESVNIKNFLFYNMVYDLKIRIEV